MFNQTDSREETRPASAWGTRVAMIHPGMMIANGDSESVAIVRQALPGGVAEASGDGQVPSDRTKIIARGGAFNLNAGTTDMAWIEALRVLTSTGSRRHGPILVIAGLEGLNRRDTTLFPTSTKETRPLPVGGTKRRRRWPRINTLHGRLFPWPEKVAVFVAMSWFFLWACLSRVASECTVESAQRAHVARGKSPRRRGRAA